MSENNNNQYIIPYEWYGLRADRALAQLFPQFSRSQLSEWFKLGQIQISDGLTKGKDKVRGGETVIMHAMLQEPKISALAPEMIALDIIFEDDACLVVNKSAGMVVHPGAGNSQHTLVNALLYHEPKLQHLPRAGLIHRLDKDTTGLLVVAKTEAAQTSLVRQMQAREIQRHYLALVYGHMITGGILETGFGRDSRNRLKMAVTAHERRAITQYSVIEHCYGTTLLNVKLMTGRTHQIRVHMAYLKHPIVGDQLYGGRAKQLAGLTEQQRDTLSQFKRQGLHAHTLGFYHPLQETLLNFTAPIPKDFQLLIETLKN